MGSAPHGYPVLPLLTLVVMVSGVAQDAQKGER